MASSVSETERCKKIKKRKIYVCRIGHLVEITDTSLTDTRRRLYIETCMY